MHKQEISTKKAINLMENLELKSTVTDVFIRSV